MPSFTWNRFPLKWFSKPHGPSAKQLQTGRSYFTATFQAVIYPGPLQGEKLFVAV